MDRTVELLLDLARWLARRPRLAIRIIRDEVVGEPALLEFEVENRGSSVTSLSPEIRCKYLYVSKLRIRRGTNRYFVREVDRHLEPFRPVVLTATPEHSPSHYGHSWFRILTFLPTRGIRTKVRIRNALLEPLGLIRFSAERLRFRLPGNVRADPHATIDSLEALRRSQGPH